MNAKLKLIKAQGQGKVRHHPSISAEDIKKCYETKVFGDETPLSLLRVNWFNIRENQRSLTKKSFTIETDANGNEYVAMAVSESTKNHQGGLADKAVDEGDPKMFSTGKSTCPVTYILKSFSRFYIQNKWLYLKNLEEILHLVIKYGLRTVQLV